MKMDVRSRRFYRWRVPCAFVVGVLALVLARPTTWSLLLGLVLVLPGLAFRLWASGHIEKTLRLATGGPYRHTQHPLYLGSVLIAMGIAVASARPAVVAAAGVYLLAFFPLVLRDESRFLHERFGNDYERWAAEVPPLIPRLLPAGPGATHFEWRRVRRNREWKAGLALLGVLAFLSLRSYFLP
jgi:protein-S-isoprenylcysteine O-methyltransferase Ste14